MTRGAVPGASSLIGRGKGCVVLKSSWAAHSPFPCWLADWWRGGVQSAQWLLGSTCPFSPPIGWLVDRRSTGSLTALGLWGRPHPFSLLIKWSVLRRSMARRPSLWPAWVPWQGEAQGTALALHGPDFCWKQVKPTLSIGLWFWMSALTRLVVTTTVQNPAFPFQNSLLSFLSNISGKV